MCGVCGIFHYHKERQVDEQLLLRMRDSMIHRGPDAAGTFTKDNVGLAHRRLSIIDVEGGKQPMANEDGSVWIVYNGELYNYQSLRAELIKQGHTFKTHSDTEVIVHAYEEYGQRCTEYLRGMFAFIVYDSLNELFFAVRDRMGIKPLYYLEHDNSVYFASEIKALLQLGDFERQLNNSALYQYFRVRYVPGPQTMFRGITKLQPGHQLVCTSGKISVNQYWDLASVEKVADTQHDSDTVVGRFEELLESSIRMRLMSEVPLGAFLSGGIDSSVVVAKMREINGPDLPVKTFSVGYEEDYGINEFGYAKQVADAYVTDHFEYKISNQNFYDFLPELVWYLDEPIADSACIPLYFLSRFAKKHVTVVLSGEGADELLAGYGIYKKMLLLDTFRKLPGIVRNEVLIGVLGQIFQKRKFYKYLMLSRLPLNKRYKGVSEAFRRDHLQVLQEAEVEERKLCGIYENYAARTSQEDPLAQMMYIDINTWLPDDLLMKADKMTMAASQELRVPFLDHKLVEFSYSLAHNYKIRHRESKYILRQIAAKLLPADIINRPKKGFPVPINRWFQNELRMVAKDTLCESNSGCRTVFEKEFLEQLFIEHASKQQDHSDAIWNLLVFEFWFKEVFSHGTPVSRGH